MSPSAPTNGPASGSEPTANGGNEGTEDLKSSDDVDDAEAEGHAISSDPEPDADDWDFDIHNPPAASTTGAPGLSRAGGDTKATGTGTSTPITEAALKEVEAAGELKIDIDWALMNDEFDAWMEGDSSEEDEGEGDGESNLNPAGDGNANSKNMEASEDEWTDETNSIIRRVPIIILIFRCSSICLLPVPRGPNVSVSAPLLPLKPIPQSAQLGICRFVLLWLRGRNSRPIGWGQVPS